MPANVLTDSLDFEKFALENWFQDEKDIKKFASNFEVKKWPHSWSTYIGENTAVNRHCDQYLEHGQLSHRLNLGFFFVVRKKKTLLQRKLYSQKRRKRAGKNKNQKAHQDFWRNAHCKLIASRLEHLEQFRFRMAIDDDCDERRWKCLTTRHSS